MNKPKIFYRIIEADPSDLQIGVRFYSETLPESALVASYKRDGRTPDTYRTDYSITLPVPVPAGDALHELIMRSCPVDWFEVMHAARDPSVDTSMPHIAVGTVREVAPLPKPEPTEAEIVAGYEQALDAFIDMTAKSYGYMSIGSAVSYATEPAVPKFQEEGLAFRAWRSLCYAKSHEVLAAVKAGNRPTPSHAELIAEMPALGLGVPAHIA